LLLAAAATFVAVRWDDIPASLKLGAIGVLTGGFLLAAHRLRPTLPATASALFHLGCFLVPVNVAAIGVRIGLTWDQMLLAQGAIATVTFASAARVQSSIVLRWASWVAVVMFAGGIGGTTPIPAGLLLAVIAAGAVAQQRDRVGDAAGLAWATVAGLAPVIALAEHAILTGSGTLERLGLVGDMSRLTGIATGIIAGTAIGIVARRRDDAGLAIIAIATGVIGVAATWTGLELGSGSTIAGLASLFLVLEMAALACGEDPFWRLAVEPLAKLAEACAAIPTALAAVVVLAAPLSTVRADVAGAAAAIAAIAWAVAGARRGGRWWPALPAATISAACAALLLSGSTTLVAAVLIASAVFAVTTNVTGWVAWVAAAAVLAPAQPHLNPGVAIGLGLAGAALVAFAAERRSTKNGHDGRDESLAILLAAWSVVPLVPGAFAAAPVLPAVVILSGLLVAGHALAALLDRATIDLSGHRLGTVVRALSPLVLGAALDLPAATITTVAAIAAGLAVLDAVRSSQPLLLAPAAIALPLAVANLCLANGYTMPEAGLALTVTAVVIAGIGSLAGRDWQLAALASAALSAGAGLVLAADDPTMLAYALLVTGGLVAASGVSLSQPAVTIVGLGASTLGLWMRLDIADVVVSEPYVAPVALLLLLAGIEARRNGAGSWLAYAPAIALGGGSALAERLAGGGAAHGVIAGSIAILAVIAGGQRRLAAPLLLGTALLVTLVGYETLAISAGVPTWAWLALGGTALLGAGVVMERRDTGPIETGKRVVDTLRDQFA
jgi:hypothetical protein